MTQPSCVVSAMRCCCCSWWRLRWARRWALLHGAGCATRNPAMDELTPTSKGALLAGLLFERPRDIDEIAAALGITKRHAYRVVINAELVLVLDKDDYGRYRVLGVAHSPRGAENGE